MKHKPGEEVAFRLYVRLPNFGCGKLFRRTLKLDVASQLEEYSPLAVHRHVMESEVSGFRIVYLTRVHTLTNSMRWVRFLSNNFMNPFVIVKLSLNNAVLYGGNLEKRKKRRETAAEVNENIVELGLLFFG
jgi:hypothetical protein